MGALNRLACLVALLISAGEIARFWGNARFIPMALDELGIAAALLWAALRSSIDGACWHIPAWGAFCGLVLVLLVQTADHQMHGPAKAAGPLYLTVLGFMLVVGLWATLRALHLVRRVPVDRLTASAAPQHAALASAGGETYVDPGR